MSRFISDGFAKFTRTVLTSEPPLDPPEPANLVGEMRRRRMRQEAEYENQQYEQFLNECRMHDALEDSLIEREGR